MLKHWKFDLLTRIPRVTNINKTLGDVPGINEQKDIRDMNGGGTNNDKRDGSGR